ncbi:MAG: ABC transporter ATP-binding protein [Trueperaceae bacterium]|nr:ABC transporter ATP-binding protein [Trueperaceae bacterium]
MPPSSGPQARPPLLELRGVTKRFPGVVANDGVDLQVRRGEVHALLGENGAGKTTLVHMLYGLQAPDEGALLMDGAPLALRSPRDAKAAGIGLVAQHFHLARRHTVAENLALALPDTPAWFPTRHLARRVDALAERYGFEVDLHARVATLSPGERQRVEILKALLQGADALILDEPTSVLTPQEAQRLFDVLGRMKDEGRGVILISHKLDEVLAAADRITVLRGGRVVAQVDAADTDTAELARHMVGREVRRGREAAARAPGDVRLSVRDLHVADAAGEPRLRGVHLEVRAGEIVGVAGVAGNGQAELTQVLTGLRTPTSGRIELDGADVAGEGVRDLFARGVVHIPEDRNDMGVAGGMKVAENLVLRRHRQAPFAKGRMVDWRAVDAHADGAIRDYAIATPSRDAVTRNLSGGNVQKVILARELGSETGLVVASHPSYGLDVAATELTHDLLREQRDRGAAVLLVSEDLDELLDLADRIVVLFRGEVTGVVDAATATREAIGLRMAGERAPERDAATVPHDVAHDAQAGAAPE